MKQRLVIDNFLGGLAPSIYSGDPQSQSDPVNTAGWDVFRASNYTDFGLLRRGYGQSTLTNASVVTGSVQFMKSINRSNAQRLFCLSQNDGVLSNQNVLHAVDLSNNSVLNASPWPHTLGGTNGVGLGMEFFNGYLYYASGRYLGRYDLSITFNDSYNVNLGTSSQWGDTIQHPMAQGNGKLYIGNTNFSANTTQISTDDGSGAISLAALDLSRTQEVVKALSFDKSYLFIAGTQNTGNSANIGESHLYLWNTVTNNSWQQQFKFPEEDFQALAPMNGDMYAWGRRGFYKFNGYGFELIQPIIGGPGAGGVDVAPNNIVYFRDESGRVYGYGSPNALVQPIVFVPFKFASTPGGALKWTTRTDLYIGGFGSTPLRRYGAVGEATWDAGTWRTPMINFGQRTRVSKVYIAFFSWPGGASVDVVWASGDGSSTTTIGTISNTGDTFWSGTADGLEGDHWQIGLNHTSGSSPQIRRIVIEYEPIQEQN